MARVDEIKAWMGIFTFGATASDTLGGRLIVDLPPIQIQKLFCRSNTQDGT